ncbi:unnamed protein product, partial [Iphiclides podalirius]
MRTNLELLRHDPQNSARGIGKKAKQLSNTGEQQTTQHLTLQHRIPFRVPGRTLFASRKLKVLRVACRFRSEKAYAPFQRLFSTEAGGRTHASVDAAFALCRLRSDSVRARYGGCEATGH